MRRILGVFMALFMCCVPIGIQAQEEVLSFEYTGQKIEIDDAIGYHLIDDDKFVLKAPKDCGRYRAYYSDGSYIEYEITPKVVHVKVKYNKDWRPGDPEENRYLCEYDGDYEFILSSYVNGDFKTDYDDNYKFEFEPKNKKDVEIVKTTITHPDVEYVYTGSDIVIDSKVDSISPIAFKNVGEYIVSFNVDSNYYESIPFKVTILPKTVQLRLNKYQKYVGEKDPVLETDDYILTREVGEDVGNYKLTAKSKSRNYKYEIDVFTILENKSQQVKQEVTNSPSNDEKREPLQSVNVSNKDKNKYADASDKNTSMNIETKVDKESAKTETKVVTGVFNLTPMYLSFMTISLVVAMYIMYILIKKRNVKI